MRCQYIKRGCGAAPFVQIQGFYGGVWVHWLTIGDALDVCGIMLLTNGFLVGRMWMVDGDCGLVIGEFVNYLFWRFCMFENIGGKIKVLAKVCTWIGIGGSVLAGVPVMIASGVAGLIVIVVGCLASWVGSFLLYGFGQLVENSDKMAANSEKVAANSATLSANSELLVGNAKKMIEIGEELLEPEE